MRFLAFLATSAFLAAPAFSQGQGKGKGQSNKETVAASASTQPPKEQYPAFSDAEIRITLDYYRPGSGHLPPGLAKRGGELPPGLERQLRRRGALPPGLEKKIEPFPDDLLRRLAPLPAGYRRILAGNTALIIQDATNLIVDLLNLR